MMINKNMEVQCPGCGSFKKQLTRHIKTNKECLKRFSKIDLTAFEKQLKTYKNTSRKKTNREKQRKENERKVNAHQNNLKAANMKKQRKENEVKVKADQNNRKAANREKQRKENEVKVKADQNKSKAKSIAMQRQDNEMKVKADQNNRQRNHRRTESDEESVYKFWRRIIFGPIFPCICCERLLFENNVDTIKGLEEKVEAKAPGLFKKCIPALKKRLLVKIIIKDQETTEKHYICHACKKYLLNKKMPPMCAENGLRTEPLQGVDENNPTPVLTELERNLIAHRILFMKIHRRLPKSLWRNLNGGRIINIPINKEDIMNTIQVLPRTPSEAGLVPVDFKRRLEYKASYVVVQLVSPEKMYKALEYLKARGHPSYQSFDEIAGFRERLTQEDQSWMAGPSPAEEGVDEPEEMDQDNLEKKDIEEEEAEKDETEYRKNDPVKKNQADAYDRSVLVSDMYPEIHRESEGSVATVAPGEGKTPKTMLYDTDWDIQAFPDLNPDGKDGLHHKREVRITHQNFFVQRICNVETKYAKTPTYVYAAVGYHEQKQIASNMGLQGSRGREVIGEGGKRRYVLEDAYAVLENIKQTPRYWKTAKYEFYAKLDNLGAFHIFFTLSCADLRWTEALATALRNEGIEVQYCMMDPKKNRKGKKQEEEYEAISVNVNSKTGDHWIPLDKYLKEEADKTRHEYIRENVLTLTRIFNNRVKAFIAEVVMNSTNPMCVYKWSYKTEFQQRGAAHVHGVMWLNMNALEKVCQLKSGELIKERDVALGRRWIIDKINASGETVEKVRKKKKPFEGAKEIFAKLRTNKCITPEDKEVLIKLINCFTTVSLCPAEVGADVATTAEEVNKHSHTITCRKYGGTCRFNFPRFPSKKTVIAGPEYQEGDTEGWALRLLKENGLETDTEDDMEEIPDGLKQHKKSPITRIEEHLKKELNKVKKILEDEDAMKLIKQSKPKKGDTVEEYEKMRDLRIKMLLKVAGVKEEIYYTALAMNKKGYIIVQKRDIDETMINSYNPLWLKAWNGNIDVSICLDFFGVITYITEYIQKQEKLGAPEIKKVLDNCKDSTLKEKMAAVAETFQRSRQIGEAEGFYKLLPDHLLKNSNVACQYLSLSDPSKKVKRMRRAEEDVKTADHIYKEVEGKEGLWKEQPDMVTKWLRRKGRSEDEEDDGMADPMDICLAQFAKMYTSSRTERPKLESNNCQSEDIDPEEEDPENGWKKKQAKEVERLNYEESEDQEARFIFVMKGKEDANKPKKELPFNITITDPLPGEPNYMKRRTFPQALRFHRSKEATNPVQYIKEEIMLYSSDYKEDLSEWADTKIIEFYNENQESINRVRKQVMEYVEDVQEARHYVDETTKKLDLEETAALIDAQKEQEDADLEGEAEEDSELQHLDPGEEGSRAAPKLFKKVDLPDSKILKEKTMSLDPFQRMVVDIAIKYARDIKKAENPINKMPKPPHLMVHGGAGAGKTTVIRTVVHHMESILRKSGDESEQPYVLLCAPTGAAASLIEGITLHKAFNFDFSGHHYSLSDKMRDLKKMQLKELKLLVIDEVSMVNNRMLYQIDLRLQEVKERPNIPFGGVCLMCFGDVMQLKPVMAPYIFERPGSKNENYQLVFDIASRWHMLKVINLEINHRQGEDKMYADLLNRMRTGDHTEEDLQELMKRVRVEGHKDFNDVYMYVVCTRSKVMKINSDYYEKHPGEGMVLKAIHSHAMQKNYKPQISKEGEVGETGFMDHLKLKLGLQVMLVSNIDVTDCLTNGQLGTLSAAVKTQDGKITKLMVNFNNQNVGKVWRQENPGLAIRYPTCTGIDRVNMAYSLEKNCAKHMTLIQFPIKMAKAVTAHKIQGQSIPKPLKVAMDIKGTFAKAQGYVMLSRVEDINQLIIMDSITTKNIEPHPGAKEELKMMNNRSLNNNQTPWKKEDPAAVKVAALNIMNLRNNMSYLRGDPTLAQADIICLSETWVESKEEESLLQVQGFEAVFNSSGRGKGVVSFIKDGAFTAGQQRKLQGAQMSLFQSKGVDVIQVYRSQRQSEADVMEELKEMIDRGKTTLICGDMNICLKKHPDNHMTRTLTGWGMEQLNDEASHTAGGHIDHVYLTKTAGLEVTLERYTPFYTDHDAHLLTLTPKVSKLYTYKILNFDRLLISGRRKYGLRPGSFKSTDNPP